MGVPVFGPAVLNNSGEASEGRHLRRKVPQTKEVLVANFISYPNRNLTAVQGEADEVINGGTFRFS